MENMKNTFLTLVVVALFAPLFVSADSYDGPYCFEDASLTDKTSDDYATRDNNNIRGTCKEVGIKTVVSLDPILQKDYFLGTHAPIEYNCDRGGCEGKTTYSEHLFLTSSSTLEAQTMGVEESPLQYALFGKAYFVPLLSNMFKESNLPFSENTVPNLGIYVFKKSELDEIQKVDPRVYLGDYSEDSFKMDSLKAQKDYSPERYAVYSFNYQEYGKYIYAPKGTLVESQYAGFEKAGNILSDKDLQIMTEGYRGSVLVVPVTSPLKSVANYWIYTKKDGKLVLSWQKSEYVLDNGQVKIVTSSDKNISAALLFSNAFPPPKTIPPSIEPASSTASTSPVFPVVTEQKKGFFARALDLILSWFR